MITDADIPADNPKNSSKAGPKSPELIPCKYISGNTSDTLGLFLHHGGTITLLSRCRSPVTSSTRRSFTPGPLLSGDPEPLLRLHG